MPPFAVSTVAACFNILVSASAAFLVRVRVNSDHTKVGNRRRDDGPKRQWDVSYISNVDWVEPIRMPRAGLLAVLM